MHSCPSHAELFRYLSGELDSDHQSLIENHLLECPDCEADAQEIEESEEFRITRLDVRTPFETPDLKLDISDLFNRNRPDPAEDSQLASMFKFSDYELERVIGRGGMGIVFRALQKSTRRHVALKVIHPSKHPNPFSNSDEYRQRFAAEIAAAAKIDHDNVVKIYDGRVDDEYQYYAMQLVDGDSLWQSIRNGLEPRDAARFVRDAALGMSAAHEMQVLHRDIKPQNILISNRHNRALVSDFGLSKSSESIKQSQTQSIVGTLNYMSPEQLEDSSKVGVGTDIYGLGATLYFCLTGNPPFANASISRQINDITNKPAIPPRKIRPEIHRDLEAICLKCLNKQPSQRYLSSLDLAHDLERFLDGEPTVARPIGTAGKLAKWSRRKPVLAGLTLASSLLLLTLIGAGIRFNQKTGQLNKELVAANETESKLNDQLKQALKDEQSARKQAEANLAAAQRLTREFSIIVSESPELLRGANGMQELRRKLMTMAKLQLDRFVQSGHVESTTPELIELLVTDARIARELGLAQDANQLLEQAESLCRAQLKSGDESSKKQKALFHRLAEILHGRALASQDAENYEASIEQLAEAWALICQTNKTDPQIESLNTHVSVGHTYGANLIQAGNVKRAMEIFDASEKAARKLLKLLEEAKKEKPDFRYPASYSSIVVLFNTIATSKKHGKDSQMKRLEDCVEIFEQIKPEFLPPAIRKVRAGIFMNMGTYLKLKDKPRSLKYRRMAVAEFRKLSKTNEKVPDFKYHFAMSARNLANAIIADGDLETGKQLIDEASQATDRLLKADPESDKYLYAQSLICDSMAIYVAGQGRFDQAKDYLNEKLLIAQKRLSKRPSSASRIHTVGLTCYQLGECEFAEGRLFSALGQLKKATEYSEQLEGGAKQHLQELIGRKLRAVPESMLDLFDWSTLQNK